MDLSQASGEPKGSEQAAASKSGPLPANSRAKSTGDRDAAELTTRLTRCRFKRAKGHEAAQRRSVTKFEQSLRALAGAPQAASLSRLPPEVSGNGSQAADAGPAASCRFKAQMVFESDTDSAAERQSLASAGSLHRQARSGTRYGGSLKKELVSETKYSLTQMRPEELARRRRELLLSGPQPNWDYTLRVNRMCGNRLDSRAR